MLHYAVHFYFLFVSCCIFELVKFRTCAEEISFYMGQELVEGSSRNKSECEGEEEFILRRDGEQGGLLSVYTKDCNKKITTIHKECSLPFLLTH